MHKRIRCTGTDSLSSSCVLFWLCTQLLVVASALIVTPILIGVTQRYLLSSPLVLIGHICDALMAVDVAIAKATCLRKKRRKILAVSPSWLLLIMSSALVVVPVVYSLGGAEDTLAWCTIFRMLAVLKLPPLYRLFKQAMEKKGLFVHETYVRVVLVFVFAIFYSSILACAWFYLSCRRRDLSTCLLDDGLWVARDSVLDIRDPVSRYFRSLYFVVQTLFTIGYGDIYPVSNSEIMFTLFLILNGSLFYAFMISSITSLLSNRDATTKLFRSETNVIKDFFSARGVASDIAEQMQGYFDFLFSRKKGVLEGTVLAALPSSLSLAVKASFAPCLEQVAFFQAIRKHCACFAGAGAERASRCTCCGGIDIVRACAEQLTFSNYAPGSALASEGDAHRCLFIILSGRVDILRKGSRCALLSLREGDHIGEEALILNSRWSLSVVAAEYTEAVTLDADALLRCLRVTGALHFLGAPSVDEWLKKAAGGTAVQAAIKAAEQFQRQCRIVQTNISQTQQKKKIMQMLERTDIVDESWTIQPGSSVHLLWQVVYLMGILYYLLSTPLRLVDQLERCQPDESLRACLSVLPWHRFLDYVADTVMAVNMVLHSLFFAFVQLEGSVPRTITDHGLIWDRFRHSGAFALLCVLVVPTDLLALQLGYLTCFRFNKLVAFFLLPGAVTEVCGFFSIHLLLTISSEAITVIHLAYTAVLLCIWLAAGWTVITHLGPHPNSDFLDGAYWSLSTMTTVGYGDIIPRSTWETVFVTIACIAGPCMCATIIANTASFMKNDDSSSSNSSHRKSCIQSFVSSHRPRGPAGSGPTHHHTMIARGSRLSDPLGATNSKDIRLASVDYFDLLQGSEMSGMDETQTIAAEGSLVGAHFTHHMKQLLIGDTVQASEVFNGASPFIMGKIISEMEPQYFTKGSLVLAAGDTSHLMYFVKSGVVQIYNQHGRRTQRLLQGDFFAASALLPGYHIITFRATAFKGSELWVLSRQRFADLVALYPEELSDKLMIHIEETAIRNTLRITDPLAPAIRALRHINNLREPNKSFIEPESMRYALWCVAITGVALYNAYMIPLRLAFGEQVPFNLTFLADYFGDFLCLLDVALNMLCLGYYDKDDLVLVRDRIKDNYIQKGHFVYHLMAALPTDLICVLMWQLNTPSLFSTSQLLSLLRLNRLIRLLDVRSLLGYIECVFMRRSTGATMSRDDGNDNGTILLNLVRLGKLLCLVFFAIHFVACIFFFIANEAHMRQAENWGDSLGIMRDCSLGDCEESPSIALLLHQYVYAMYWATATVSTVGYGDVVAISKNERIYNVLVFLVGTSVYAMAIVHLQDIVAQLNVTSGIFKARCDRISSFLQREGAADHVFRKNKAYVDRLWTKQRGASSRELQQFLPRHIYGSLVGALSEGALSHLFFVRFCPPSFVNTLSQHLHAAIYLPPDFIFYTGSRAERLYLLTSGEIELVDESTGERYALMAHRPSSGPSVGGAAANTLGEAEFFQRSTYACGARVLQDMHCFELKFDALWALVLQYRLEGAYKAQMTIHEASLHRSSTHFIVNALRLNLKNAKMAKIMRATETVAEMSNFYLLPNSPFCQVWTLLSASVVIYWALSVPYRIAFETVGPSTVFADVFSCLFLCLDVYFKMSYFAVEVNGDLISTSAEFRRVYMENDLAFDIIACLPVPLMVLGLTQSGVVYCILRCVHMLKLRQLSTLLQRLITFLEPLFNIRFPENVSRILTTVATVWYFGHVICCLLCLIGIHEADASSWLVANNVADRDELSRYLLAYLWSMYTVVTVGYGSVSIVSSEERVLAIVAMISGAILCDAGVAAVLSSMIDAQDRQGGIVKRQFDATAAFCKNHCTFISSDVSKLVLSYFTHLSHSLGGHEEMSDVAALPPVIWLDLVRMASLRSLCAIDFIDSTVKDLKLGFVNSLVLCAEPYIAYPGQILGGPLSDDLFILRRGKVYSMGSSAVVMLNGRCPAHSLASVASDDPDDDVAGSKYSSSHKEYLHKGSVIYKASEVRRDMSKNQADDIAGAVPLAKSVFVTIVSISDFQDRACYMGKNGTTDMPEGPGNAGLSTGGGYGEEYRSNLKPRAAVESILSAVNSVMSRGVSSYVRITCGAQKARTTTEVRRGTNRWKPALLPSTDIETEADMLWDQNFQFEVPADTNVLKMSLFIPTQSVADMVDRNIGAVSMSLDKFTDSCGESEGAPTSGVAFTRNCTDKQSLHGRLNNGRRTPTPKGSVLPSPAPLLPFNDMQGGSGPQVKFYIPQESVLPLANHDEFLESVNATLNTIDLGQELAPNFNEHCSTNLRQGGDSSSSFENGNNSSAASSYGSPKRPLDGCIDCTQVPCVIYNSFAAPIETTALHGEVELYDLSQPFDSSADLGGEACEAPDNSINYDKSTTTSVTATENNMKRLKRRNTLSFKSRSLVLDIRNDQGMYVGKIHFKVSVRASRCDGRKREKVKKLLGGDEHVKNDEGKYCCETFCHMLRIPQAKIQDLQTYYRVLNYSVQERLDHLILAANDEETEHAMKPRNAVTTDTMLKNMASTPEIEHGMGVHVPSMKSKIAPLSALLCAIRHLKAVKSKGDTIKNVPALADVKLNSSNISAALVSSSIQGRRRSSVAPRKVNDIEDNSLVGSTQANSRPTSPGLATCNSEMDAFLFRASKCTIKLP